MTDYRQLCVELVNELHGYKVAHPNHDTDLIDRARAALAEPEPEPPTDEGIMALMPQQMRDDLAAAARAMAGFDPDNIKAASIFRIILNRHCVDHARAILARWGNHPGSPDSSMPQPVPVSERLPGPEDCDAEGRCWLGGEQFAVGDLTWILGFPAWAQRFPEIHRYWLPAHDLPLPEVNND